MFFYKLFCFNNVFFIFMKETKKDSHTPDLASLVCGNLLHILASGCEENLFFVHISFPSIGSSEAHAAVLNLQSSALFFCRGFFPSQDFVYKLKQPVFKRKWVVFSVKRRLYCVSLIAWSRTFAPFIIPYAIWSMISTGVWYCSARSAICVFK